MRPQRPTPTDFIFFAWHVLKRNEHLFPQHILGLAWSTRYLFVSELQPPGAATLNSCYSPRPRFSYSRSEDQGKCISDSYPKLLNHQNTDVLDNSESSIRKRPQSSRTAALRTQIDLGSMATGIDTGYYAPDGPPRHVAYCQYAEWPVHIRKC